MPAITSVLWRSVTRADFFNIERAKGVGPDSGGGQTYISLSFGLSMDHSAFGRFLNVTPPDAIRTTRPRKIIEVAVLEAPSVTAPLAFEPRYTDLSQNDRYRIARQNRRRTASERHPAWMPERGFPAAPKTVQSKDDPAVPDLSVLKIFVAKTDDGQYFAGFTNQARRPNTLPATLDVLFEDNDTVGPNGILHLSAGSLDLDVLRSSLKAAATQSVGRMPSAPEIEDAFDAVATNAGRRSRGQGFRLSQEDRRAIEMRAMEVAQDHLESSGWKVEDVSTTESYDFHCTRRGAPGTVLYVEVKGTTGDGSAVLLTPNEVELARARHPDTALLIVSGVSLQRDADDGVVASGGALDELAPWHPDHGGELQPVGFRYLIP